VEAIVCAQFGVKRARQHSILPHEYRRAFNPE
jgi:hypothetical protein